MREGARAPVLFTAIAGALSLCLYLGLAFAGDLRQNLGLYLGGHALLFAIYLLVVWRTLAGLAARRAAPSGERSGPAPGPIARFGKQGLLLAAFAVAFRAVLVPAPAALSDDLHRYVWDGRVQAAGVNPYLHPPDADDLVPLRDEGWERINHPEIRTIYPPLAEALFGALAAAGLRQAGFKAVFCLFDLGVVLALVALLRLKGKPVERAVIYAWNPLVIVEVASSGHLDPVGLCLLLASAVWVLRQRRALSIAAYAGSVMARLLPLIYLPIMIRRFKIGTLLLGAAVLLAGYAPYAPAGRTLFSGLGAYAEHWDHNSVVFPALRALLEASVPVETLKGWITLLKDALGDPAGFQILYEYVWPGPLARVLLAAALAAGVLLISIEATEIHRELYLSTGLLLILSPTLHPWYLLWILPFAAIEISAPWILFSALVPLSYLSARTADGRCPAWVLALEWGAPLVLAAVLALRGRAARLRAQRHEGGVRRPGR